MGIGFPKPTRRRRIKLKQHKFGAVSTKDLDGIENPSKLAANVANVLIARRENGESKGFYREYAVRLKEKCQACDAAAMIYKVDFVEIQLDDSLRYIEAKGAETAPFKRRKKQWPKTGPGDLEIWRGKYQRDGTINVYCAETIPRPKPDRK